jgi:integrase
MGRPLMAAAAILLKNYQNHLSSDGKTRTLYLKYAKDFLDHSSGIFTREEIQKYLTSLRRGEKKYSDGTVNFAFRVIRTLYNRNSSELIKEGIEWPFRRGETPQIRENTVQAPALDPGLIIEMINKVKAEGEPNQRAFFSLSTTFGLRREEILELDQGQIDYKSKTIHIRTLKHGRERTHLLPDDIIWTLQDYDFPKISEFALLKIWYKIEFLNDFPHQEQVGWHSIRRTLNTLLLDELPENVVMSFLRWKQRTSSNMPFRYSAQRFIGREDSTVRVFGESKEMDQKVYEVHPFINYWRE